MEKIKYSYARLVTKICVNSTKTFQTQTGWASFLDEDPNMAYNNFIDEYSRAGGGGGGKRRVLGPRNDVLTTCKAVTKRGVQRKITVFYTPHSKYFYTF